VAISIVTLFLSLFLLLLIPSFQTYVVNQISNWLTSETGHTVNIETVQVKWFDQAVINGLEVYDLQDNIMVRMNEVMVDFDLRNLTGNSKFIDQVLLYDGEVRVTKYSDTTAVNLTTFLDSVKVLITPKEGRSVLHIENIDTEKIQFSFNHLARDSIVDRFDYNHFELSDIKLNVAAFNLVRDTIDLKILSLNTEERRSGLRIDEMKSFFRICQKSLSLGQLELRTPRSVLKDSLIFTFSRLKNLSYLKDSVSMFVNLDDSRLHSKDLGLFSSFFQKFNEPYQFTGILEGKVKDLNMRTFNIEYGNGSRISGDAYFKGLPKLDETYIDATVDRSYFDSKDLVKFIPSNAHDLVQRFSRVYFKGSFNGLPKDTVSFDGEFITDLGNFNTNLSMGFHEGRKTIYKGYLETFDFQLGRFIKAQDKVRNVDFAGSIDGVGLDIDNAKFDVTNAIVRRIGITYNSKSYTLNNIQTTASLAEGFFEGKITVDDPELMIMEAEGLVDIRPGHDSLKLKGSIDTLFISRMGISNQLDFINGDFDLNFEGFDPFNFNIDSLTGTADLDTVLLVKGSRSHTIEWLNFTASENPQERLALSTSNIDINVNGNFSYSTVFKDLTALTKEYILNFKNQREELVAYYSSKEIEKIDRYKLNYEMLLRDMNPFLNVFMGKNDTLGISSNAQVEGMVLGGETRVFNLYANFDTLSYNDQYFLNNSIEFNSSKVNTSTNVLAALYLQSDKQMFRNFTKTKNLFVGGVWNNDRIDYEFNIAQEELNNYAAIRGDLMFLNDTIKVHLEPDSIGAFDNKWEIDSSNLLNIVYQDYGYEASFLNFNMSSDEQNLRTYGTISKDPRKSFHIDLEDVMVSNFNPLLPKQFEGTATGQFALKTFKQDEDSYAFQIDTFNIGIDSLYIEEFLIGDLSSALKKAPKEDHYNLNLFLDRDQRRAIDVQGIYVDSLKNDPLNLTATFDSAGIRFIEPFFDRFFSDFSGSAAGSFTITGSLRHPVFRGQAYIGNGHLKVNYLNTDFDFNGYVGFRNDTIEFSRLNIFDPRSNQGMLTGIISHDGFRDYYFDLEGSFTDLLVLNTNAEDNSQFYGTGIGSGTIEFLGPASNMAINVEAATRRGTRISIPIGGSSSIEQKDYINFISLRGDSTSQIEDPMVTNRTNLKGLKINLGLDVTPDAYGEIIFDLTAGDIIRGRGNGRLDMNIDTEGDFAIFGDLEFVEGWYNFTMYNIINKEFNILPQSRISWRGDPYEAQLNIQAAYNQLASVAPLLNTADEQVLESSEIRRKYPSQVLLDLEGPMLQPDIRFDVKIEEYPDVVIANGQTFNLGTEISAFYNRIDADEQELKRQVFSLIILKRFSPEDFYDTRGSIGSSVSEFVSNQLSYWISQVDENLEIDVDLGRLDQDALNTFQLRMSYTFLDGRLRVTRDGGFVNNQNQTDVGAIIGDWTVEYLLDPSGELRAKMYNKTNYRDLTQTYNSSIPFTAGFSIIWTQSFDDISEKIKEAKQRENDAKRVTSQNSEAVLREDESY